MQDLINKIVGISKIMSVISATIISLSFFLKSDIEKKIEPYYMQVFRKVIKEFIIMILSLFYILQIPYLNMDLIKSSKFILSVFVISIIFSITIFIHNFRIFNMKKSFMNKIKEKIIKFQNRSIKPISTLLIIFIIGLAVLCNNWLLNELNEILREDNNLVEEFNKKVDNENEKLKKNSMLNNSMDLFLMSHKNLRTERDTMTGIKIKYAFLYIMYYIFFRIALVVVYKNSFSKQKCYLHFILKSGKRLDNTILKSKNKEAYIVYSEDNKIDIVILISELSEIEISSSRKEKLKDSIS